MCGCSTRRPRTAIRPARSPATADPTTALLRQRHTPANGLNGAQLANPFDPGAVLGENDRTTTQSTTTGFSLQATNTDQLFGHNNHFVVGTSFDYSVTHFNASAELGTIGPELRRRRHRRFSSVTPAIRFRTARFRCAPPINIPGSMRSIRSTSPTAFSITGGGRFNVANISLQDQSATALNGNDTYDRFNPIIGGTYKITSGLDRLCRLFRSQPRADAAGTGMRRSEQSLHHRLVPGLRSAAEAGGVPHRRSRTSRHRRSRTSARWNGSSAAFRADQHRRHPRDSQPDAAGVRLFPERRLDPPPGHRGRGQLKSDRLQINASYTFVDARFLDRYHARLQQSVRRRQRQYPGHARQSDPGRSAQPAQGRHRLFRHRRVQGRRRCDLCHQPVFCRRRIQSGSRSCRPTPSSTCMPPIRSTSTSSFTRGPTTSLDNRYATYGTFFDTGDLPNFANGGAPSPMRRRSVRPIRAPSMRE